MEPTYVDDADLDTEDKEDEWEVDFTLLELNVEISPPGEWIKGILVFKVWDTEEHDLFYFDEAYIKLRKEGIPFYLIIGKRYAPFGVFENHLVSDTLPQDLYEINPPQITVGIRPGRMDTDASLTLYKGNDLIRNLRESGGVMTNHDLPSGMISSEDEAGPFMDEEDSGISLILAASLTPWEGLGLHAYYNFEEGHNKNNHTAGGALSISFWKLILAAEAIFALERDEISPPMRHAGINSCERLDGNFKERAWTATLAFEIIDPVTLAVRVEDFHHGADGEKAGALDWRASIGGKYNVWSHERLSMSLDIGAEYRYSEFEKGESEDANDRTSKEPRASARGIRNRTLIA